MCYGSLGTQNSMVTLIFKYDWRKGQLQVKLGQIRSNFKNSKLSCKSMPILCSFVSVFQKCHVFYVRQLEMPKIAFQKCGVITFTCFFGHRTAKNKDIALKICLHVVCMYFDHIYSVFWIS